MERLTVKISVEETINRIPEILKAVSELRQLAENVNPELAKELDHKVAQIIDELITYGTDQD